MKKSYKIFTLFTGIILMLPANASASGSHPHATVGMAAILFIVAVFVAWLLYRAIKKKKEY